MTPDWYNFPDYLAERFPALAAEIEQSYLDWAEHVANPYPHFFLEEFLIPILIGEGPLTTAEARRTAGEVLDEVLLAADTDLASAGLTSVVEMLRDEPELRMKAWPHLGPTAREWLEQLLRP